MADPAAVLLARLAKPKWAGQAVPVHQAWAEAAALLTSEFSLAEAGMAKLLQTAFTKLHISIHAKLDLTTLH